MTHLPFVEEVYAAGVIEDATPISTVLGNVLSFLLSIFSVLAIIIVVGAGIRYLLSAGDSRSAEGAKKMIVMAVIGVIVALASLVIVRQIGSFF